MRCLPVLCLLSLSLGAAPGTGEPPVPQGRTLWRSFGIRDGLDNLATTHACQDIQGFIWVGTQANLFRYEAGRFRAFGLREGLPSSFVTALLPAPDRGVLVGTWAGLAQVDLEHTRTYPRLPASRVLALARDAQGQLWVSFPEGLWRGREDALERVQDWPGPGPVAMAAEASGRLWATQDRQLLALDPGRPPRLVQTFPEPLQALASFPPHGVVCRGPQGLWLVPPAGPPQDLREGLPAPPSQDGQVHVDAQGRLWVSTLRGLAQWTGQRWDILNREVGLPVASPTGVLLDREGGLWAIGRGIHRRQGLGHWQAFTHREGLPHDQVWAIQRDPQGRLWVGTSEGLAQAEGGRWRRLATDTSLEIRCLTNGAQGLWIGTHSQGILRLEQGRLTRPLGKAHGLPEDRILTLHEDPEGLLWVGTAAHGLWRGRPGTGTFAPVMLPGGTSQERINQILPGPGGALWVAGTHGLARWQGGRWQRFHREHGLRHAHVACLAFLPDGRLALGYFEPLGLSLFTVSGDRLHRGEHLDATNGLHSDLVYFLRPDRDGRLWVGTGRGLDILSKGHIFHQGRSDGLVGEDCNALAILAEPDGSLWVGTSEGLAHHAGPWAECTHPSPPVAILDARLGGKPCPEGATFPRHARDLSVRFAPLSSLHEDQIRFEYRLSGHDETWIQGTVNEARFVNLVPGAYRLEARTRLGDREPGPLAVRTFSIQPAWWQRPLVLGLGGIALAGLLGWLLRWRMRALRQRAMELEVLLNLADQLTRELESSNRSLQEQSMTDPLTGLRNRRYVYSTIDKDVAAATRAHSVRAEGRPVPNNSDLVFVMVDVDHFKRVNDTHGHPAGDAVLTQMAEILKGATRGSDAVIRWGGEEFLVVARHANREDAATLAERIRSNVARHPFHIPSGQALSLTCSVGFCAFPVSVDEPLGWEQAVQLADQCLYLAKGQGRNRWRGHAGLELGPVAAPLAGPPSRTL